MKFDVVVVGAGTAGCLAAKTVAEAGLHVCLLDRKKETTIGEKICGDALGDHHLKTLGMTPPQGGELAKRIEGIKIYSPDLETVFTIAHEDFVGYMLNRHLFGQWLLNKALDTGAQLFDSMLCLKPIIEKNFVTGVTAKNLKTKEIVHLQSKVVMDATGFLAVIRRKLPAEMRIENHVEKEDVEACYREIRHLTQEAANSKYCEIYLNQRVTPGGYSWIFPMDNAKVNVGLGLCMRNTFPNPKRQYYQYVLSKPLFDGSSLLSGGAWYDPTRKPLDNMAGNGVLILGDAACLVNPVHGGGIGPSMLSGHLAGKTVIEAMGKDDVSQKTLWPYNCEYMALYGAKQAGLNVFRFLLLTTSNEHLNYGMKYKLMTAEDVLKAGTGEDLRLNMTETVKRVFRGLKSPRFLNKLRLTAHLMKRVKAHYRNYPSSSRNFEVWRAKTKGLFDEAKLKIMGKPL